MNEQKTKDARHPSVVVSLARVWRLHTVCCRARVDLSREPYVIEHSAAVRCRRCKQRLRVLIRDDAWGGTTASWTAVG